MWSACVPTMPVTHDSMCALCLMKMRGAIEKRASWKIFAKAKQPALSKPEFISFLLLDCQQQAGYGAVLFSYFAEGNLRHSGTFNSNSFHGDDGQCCKIWMQFLNLEKKMCFATQVQSGSIFIKIPNPV